MCKELSKAYCQCSLIRGKFGLRFGCCFGGNSGTHFVKRVTSGDQCTKLRLQMGSVFGVFFGKARQSPEKRDKACVGSVNTNEWDPN